jgi:AraC-like DNA-binding protein
VPTLSHFVAETTVRTPNGQHVAQLPDGRTALVFRLLDDGRADLHVVGPRQRAAYKRATPCRLFIKIVFRPGGGAPFFGVPLVELVDRVVPLADLWGAPADAALDEVAQAGSDRDRVAALEDALLRRMQGSFADEPFAAPVVRQALARLSSPQATLPATAEDLNLSGRSLRRAFAAVVGLSPKHYVRIVRFQRAVALSADGSRSWAAIAAAAGYFDQAHLCADFREFARVPPTAFRRPEATDELSHTCV